MGSKVGKIVAQFSRHSKHLTMKYFFALVLLVFQSISFSQSFDDIIRDNPYVECKEVFYHSYDILNRLYQNNHIDSMYSFLNYWKAKCGEAEVIFRFQTLLDIQTGRFEAGEITIDWIDNLVYYKSKFWPVRVNLWTGQILYRDQGFDEDLAHSRKLKSLSMRMAHDIVENVSYDADFIADFYGSELPTFSAISLASTGDSRLALFYYQVRDQLEGLTKGNFAIFTNVSRYDGGLALFGRRPGLGIIYGGQKRRHHFDLVIGGKIGPSPTEYTVVVGDTTVTLSSWSGVFVGLEYGYDFFTSRYVDIGVIGGVAYDGIQPLGEDNEFQEEAVTIGGYNFNAGGTVRYKFSNRMYLKSDFKYNVANYINRGGTELNGRYFEFRFSVGFLWNRYQRRMLDYLK